MIKNEGSISIYLALVFTVVLSLIGVLIESARYRSIDAKANIITANGIESAFGGYALPLFSEYGLFCTWQGDADFTESVKSYIENNMEIDDSGEYTELLNISLREIEVTDIKHATDKGGTYFASQVSDYMKYKGVSDVAEKLIEYFEKGKSLDGLRDVLKKIKKAKEKVEEISKSVCDLYEVYEYVKETGEDIQEDVKELKKEIKALKKDIKNFNDGDESITKDDLISGYENVLSIAKDLKNDLYDLCNLKESGENSYETYEGYKSESEEMFSNIKDFLSEENEGEKRDVDVNDEYDLESEINDSVISSWEYLEDAIEKVSGIKLDDLEIENIDEISNGKFIKRLNKKIELISEEIEDVKSIVGIIEDISYGDVSNESLDELGDESVAGVSANSIMEYAAGLKDDFVLGMVTDLSKVSNLSIKKDADFPSEIANGKSPKADMIDEAMYSLYTKDHMTCFTDEKSDKDLCYEMEYIFGGMNTDKKNLSKVAERLIELREINNIVAILSDSEKMTEVRGIANLTFGLAGIPAITILGEVLIIAAWAMGESVVDVRNLFAGKKIAFFKTGKDFTVSLSGLASVINGGITVSDEEYSEDIKWGLDYKTFLSILIMLSSKSDKYSRGMDIIELNIKRECNDEFRMKNCICGACVKTSFKTDAVILKLMVSEDINDGSIGEYEVEKEAMFEY